MHRNWLRENSGNFLVAALLVAGLTLIFGSRAQAQAQLDTTRREQGGSSFDAEKILRNFHASYSVSYMGPYLAGGGPGTYNLYLTDIASTQLYHSLRVGYQAGDSLQVGVGEDIANNVETITNPSGLTYHSSFEQYDPYVYFNLPGVLDFSTWAVFTSLSFSLPLSNASKMDHKLTSLVFSQVWTWKRISPEWKAGFRFYLNPLWYDGGLPPGSTSRQTFYGSFGHFLNYGLSSTVWITTATHFDVEHRSPTPDGFFNLSRSLPDYFQLGAMYAPGIHPFLLSLGIFVQGLIWKPALDTSILGANFSFGI